MSSEIEAADMSKPPGAREIVRQIYLAMINAPAETMVTESAIDRGVAVFIELCNKADKLRVVYEAPWNPVAPFK